MEHLKGQTLGNYRVGDLLGQGNRASVYSATDRITGATVALRVLDRTLGDDISFVARFRQVMASVAALRHPNLLPLLDHGVQDGIAFLARPLIPGGTLRARLGTPLPAAEAGELLRPIAGALDYAHQQGLVHGDVKPGSILLPAPGRPLLADLGTAPATAQANNVVAMARGQYFGTPEYLAPEQIQGNGGDHRIDLYALGVVLYEALVGRPPFRAERPTDTPRQVAFARLVMDPPAPRSLNPRLGIATERVLLQALERRPDRRPASATAILDALDAAEFGSPPPPRQPAPQAPPVVSPERPPEAKPARGWSRTRI